PVRAALRRQRGGVGGDRSAARLRLRARSGGPPPERQADPRAGGRPMEDRARDPEPRRPYRRPAGHADGEDPLRRGRALRLRDRLTDPRASRDLLVREAGGDAPDDVALTERQRRTRERRPPKPPPRPPAHDQPAQQRGRPIHEGPNGRALTSGSRRG